MTPPTLSPEQALARLFAPEGPAADFFATSFLAKVPVPVLQKILADLTTALGPFRASRKSGASFETVFEKGHVPTEIALDPHGRIIGLFLRPPVFTAANLDDTVAAFATLPGRTSLLVLGDGVTRAALSADTPLAVGSTFKLAVLAALVDLIAAGKHAWTDVVRLRDAHRSLPSGFLQTWPADTPLTIATLAALMISQSDNTATDALADLVGRAAMEQLAPHCHPFLTTREMFALKAPENEALLQRYRAGDEAERRRVLVEIAACPLPGAGSFGTEPRALDVEWLMSARELCQLMEKVASLPLMGINPGVAKASDWDRVAFKGGSEPGVINLTTLVESRGKRHVVVTTWNDDTASVEQMRFFTLHGQLLSALLHD